MSLAQDIEDNGYEELPSAQEEFEMKINPVYVKAPIPSQVLVTTEKTNREVAWNSQQVSASSGSKRVIIMLIVITVVVAMLATAVAAACIVFTLEIFHLKTEIAAARKEYYLNSTHDLEKRLDDFSISLQEINTPLEDLLNASFVIQGILHVNLSLLAARVAEQDLLIQEIQENIDQDIRQVFENQQRHINVTLTELQSSLENSLSPLHENLTQTELELLRLKNYTLELIGMAWETFNQNLTELKAELDTVQSELQTLKPGQSAAHPASSCAALPPSSPSGYYWVRASNGSAVRVYCDMTRSCGGITEGWMRVAELDMTNSSHQCPSGFIERTIPAGETEPHTCVSTNSAANCSVGTFFDTIITSYTKVCGKIIAYQIESPNGFLTDAMGVGINSFYVDGISLTHGSPREHIWTFAAARDLEGDSQCPGETVPANFARMPPDFVGTDYFCDTGATTIASVTNDRFFADRPLWDCENGIVNCDSSGSPPWFYRQLPQPITNSIEMRVCRNEPQDWEDVPLETIELYIQ